MEKQLTEWPVNNYKLFQEGLNGPASVSLEWLSMLDIAWTIAEGFKNAADMVIDQLSQGNNMGHSDKFLFPIAYMYRHSFELTFKIIIRDGIKLSLIVDDETLRNVRGKHDLFKLWNSARDVLSEFWAGADLTPLVAIGQIVTELTEIDNTGQTFRYACDKVGNPYRIKTPPVIDLINMKQVATGVFEFLRGCTKGLDAAIEVKLNNQGPYA